MTQRFGLYEDLSIRQNLDFIARLFELHRKDAVDASLERLGEFSRLAIGWRFVGWLETKTRPRSLHDSRTQALTLDEPTAGVDPKARREFWDQIHHLAAEGITVLVSTHYMDEAERCHGIGVYRLRQNSARGTESEIIDQSKLKVWTLQRTTIRSLLGATETSRRCAGVSPPLVTLSMSLDSMKI